MSRFDDDIMAINNARMYENTAYTDYVLDRQLTEDPDMDFTNANKRLNLLQDIFHYFYNKKVKDNPDAPSTLKKVFESLNNIDDFKNLKLTTIGNKNASYIAASKFEEEFKRLIRAIECKDRKDFDFRDDLGKYIDGNSDKFRFMLRQALTKTKEEVDMSEELNGLGVGDAALPGEAYKATTDLKKLSKKLLSKETNMKIIEMIGRFRRMAESMMRTKTTGMEELVGITMGNDLDLVLPEEIAEFMDPDTVVLFLEKFVNNNLLQFDAIAKEPEGKGDIIFIEDESGSMITGKVMMNGAIVSRIHVVRAILFGMAIIAKKQNRRLRVIRFDGGADEYKFDTTEQLMNFALNGPVKNGGTCYDTMLTKVMEVMTEERKKKSDVLILSDGESSISKEVLAKYKTLKDELGFKTVSIMIGDYGYELKKISDAVFNNVTGEDLNAESSAMKSVFGI